MIFGLHNMTDPVTQYVKEHVTGDGGASILLLDGILLIPLIFAVFFYPVAILTALAVVVVLLVGFVGLSRAMHRHRRHVGHH